MTTYTIGDKQLRMKKPVLSLLAKIGDLLKFDIIDERVDEATMKILFKDFALLKDVLSLIFLDEVPGNFADDLMPSDLAHIFNCFFSQMEASETPNELKPSNASPHPATE